MSALPGNVESVAAAPAVGRRRWRWVLIGIAVFVLTGWYGGRQLWGFYHLRGAQKALGRYDFDAALAEWECCLRVWPNHLPTRLEAARAARRAERYDTAQAHLAVCEKGDVNRDTALELAMFRVQQGDLTDADPLQNLIREGHEGAELCIEALARGYIATHRNGSAMAALNDLIEREPAHPWAYYWRGTVWEALDRPGRAVADYGQALELRPQQSDFRLRLALMLLQVGQTEKAGPHFDELLARRPDDPQVLLGAARFERACARPQRALEYLDLVVHDHPENAEAWAERGRAFRDQENGVEAVRCFRKAFELLPRRYNIGFDLCTELYGLGQTQEAKALQERVEELKRQELYLDKLMARLEQETNTAPLRYEIGTIYQRHKLDNLALVWFLSALQEDPNHRPTHRVLADYYQRKGNAQAAEHHRRLAGPSE